MDTLMHPWKLTWHWNITIFNRKCIFKRWIFHCHVSFRGGWAVSLFLCRSCWHGQNFGIFRYPIAKDPRPSMLTACPTTIRNGTKKQLSFDIQRLLRMQETKKHRDKCNLAGHVEVRIEQQTIVTVTLPLGAHTWSQFLVLYTWT